MRCQMPGSNVESLKWLSIQTVSSSTFVWAQIAPSEHLGFLAVVNNMYIEECKH